MVQKRGTCKLRTSMSLQRSKLISLTLFLITFYKTTILKVPIERIAKRKIQNVIIVGSLSNNSTEEVKSKYTLLLFLKNLASDTFYS